MKVRICSFGEAETWIRQVRKAVFIEEQAVPIEEEFDEDDLTCVHVIVTNGGEPLGTGRLGNDGRIGRVAVVQKARAKGVGRQIMQALEKHAREQRLTRVWAHAQVHALGFYERLGYRASGKLFMEADIQHKQIEKSLDPIADQFGDLI